MVNKMCFIPEGYLEQAIQRQQIKTARGSGEGEIDFLFGMLS